ncbi:succinate--CoA ligase subunit beta [Candidatus Marsarchaeota G2 archaeon BE_D]|jgi:succinyl-CoA synthetase, beta subunit|uniref:Succinate--CoA ligase [ADP-forming] subunit beta n=1 Tax=Candidatus Marsarchaeota G2 archaeon BE_D TaxID=1978158 RepID=A0A2R6CE59_9ARCH|nr:MAG: succinate--CoA ligase subunit beta [Candidatus Marsarchaeota G2 archaeon BE_D]
MKLYEYEAKKIFRDIGIPTPLGEVVTSVEEAKRAYVRLAQRSVVVKAQVLVGGRGKAGGIKFASSVEEVESATKTLLGSEIKGERVGAVLIEPKLDISRELYLGVTWDRSERSPVVIASSEGGVNIEEVAKTKPDAIKRMHVDPEIGFKPFMGRLLASSIGLRGRVLQSFADISSKMYSLFDGFDAELVESNPLALTSQGEIVAADARLNIVDDALFRHKEFSNNSDERLAEYSALERKARQLGVQYVELDGSIGIIGNGAGLTMATLDLIKYYGGEPANFLDAGGGSSEEEFMQALSILNENPKVRLVFVNILAGITRCDDVARAIVKARSSLGISKPFVIRLAGTNEEEGRRILAESGINVYSDMDEAAKKAVEVASKL